MDDTGLKVKLEWAELKASISKAVQLVKNDPRRLIGNVLAIAAVIALSYHHPIYALSLALMAVNLWTARVSITALESDIVSDNADNETADEHVVGVWHTMQVLAASPTIGPLTTEKEKNDILELWEKMKVSADEYEVRRAVERREIPAVEPVSENFVKLEAELLREAATARRQQILAERELIKNFVGTDKVLDLDYKTASCVKAVLSEYSDTEVSDSSPKTTHRKSKKKKD